MDPHTLLWIPASGLFRRDGKFYNGLGVEVPWDGTIHIFADRGQAESARTRKLEENPDARGQIVILPIHPKEVVRAYQT